MKASSTLKVFIILSLCSVAMHVSDPDNPSSLMILGLRGYFSFNDLYHAAKDFGNRYQFLPAAVLHPMSVSDIATIVKHVFQMGTRSGLTVAARGHGHSLQGQAQAPGGIVVRMESLREPKIKVHGEEPPYVDASAGELWINLLHETLKHGLAPKSWTDYLHLSIGGTLSNAGISGQAFRHGPQISNVHQLEIVTGKGEVVTCSDKENSELFYSALGGLGQFGIIVQARIALEPAPHMVRWMRVLYSDFSTFTEDQEMLILAEKTFDYIEGFVIINRTGLLNNWRSSFNPHGPVQASRFQSDGRILFCLEITKNYNPDKAETMNMEVNQLLSGLRYIPETLFKSDVTYLEFLERVHLSEVKLRAKGLWEVPHPWLNLLVPRRGIHRFAAQIFGNILADSSSGPILIYPVNKLRWDNRTSVVIPDEEVFYLVGFLFAIPSMSDHDSLTQALELNKRILDFCEKANLGIKQYLPQYTTQEQWKAHFGDKWEVFVQRKHTFDPLAILAPGQQIFQKTKSS